MRQCSSRSRRRRLARGAIGAALAGTLLAASPPPAPHETLPPIPAGQVPETASAQTVATLPAAAEEAPVFCPVCGARNRGGSRFCMKDGTPLPGIDAARVLPGFVRARDTFSPEEIQRAVHRAAESVVRIRARTAVNIRYPVTSKREGQRVLVGELEREEGETRLAGSGFVIGTNGEIVTNAHVASPLGAPAQLTLETLDGRAFPARLAGIDFASDLALLHVDTSSLPALAWGDSEELRLGEEAWAIGNPLDIGLSVTRGTISTLMRMRTGLNQVESFLHSDAYITHGNSGGPLVDVQGRVVGVSDMGFGDSKSEGYSIPSKMARLVVDRLRKSGQYGRGFVGVHVKQVDTDSITRYALKRSAGVVVESVLRGTPAESAGFRPGDVLFGINGRQATSSYLFQEAVSSVGPNAPLTITTDRGGQVMEIKVTSTMRPDAPRIDPILNLQDHMMVRFQEDPKRHVILITIPNNFSPAPRYGFYDNDIVESVLVAQDWPEEPITPDYYKRKGKIARVGTLDDLRTALTRMYLGGWIGVAFELKRSREPIAAVAYAETWPIVF